MVPPVLDEHQQAVVDHPGGPLLVLAGPGTGKTTTLVEAVVDRVERRGASPEEVLALTFSRKAAEQLRDRVTARLGRTTATALSATFHSFAYGLVRRYSSTDLYAAPLRLLSAPEQDVVLQEMLRAPEAPTWPEGLRAALATRGFAREVQAVLARAREKGLGPDELVKLGEQEDVPAYVAAGMFLGQYLDVLDSRSAIDYPDLIARAVVLAARHRDELRARFRHVFVDEYQDTDPSQVALLRELVGPRTDLTVVGDPHQSIYGFRGADVRGILDFPAQFRTTDGAKADVVVLRTTRRFGAHLLLASQRVASRLPLTGSIEEQDRRAFLSPLALEGLPTGRVEVTTYDTERAEAEHLADRLRRAHLEDGRDWADMAVLVRSGRTSIPALRRSLSAAGVPVEVASDDTPLVREPAVQPLLDALRAVVHLDAPAGHDDRLPTEAAEGLLVSPLAGLDATELRTLARALRTRERAEDRRPRPSAELLRDALLDPSALGPTPPGSPARKVAGLAALLASARAVLDGGGTAEEVLWALWSGTSWPARLRDSVGAGGHRSRLAHRDLDAVCALFETAARAEEQRGHTGVQDFLATLVAQQIPGDTLADRGVRGSAVRLLTAHRSKGLEWPLVVVAHAQEELWPDLRRRTSLLQADRIGAGELLPPVTTRDLLAEERRLFYVAATRARERLLVTAVRSTEDDGEQPSRFLAELGVEVRHVSGRPRRPLTLAGLVAELRRTVADDTRPDAIRRAAARRLARLAAADVAGRPVAPYADPSAWWGTRALSAADEPVRPVDEPLRVTASALTSLDQCPARWFLEREAGGVSEATQAQGFGNVVHLLADRISRGELPADAAAVDGLMGLVDEVWGQIPFRTPWSAAREREEVRHALTRFIAWHNRPDARTVLATEHRFETTVELPGGEQVRLHGYADRLELDAEGRVVVVDLKTGKYPASDVPRHPQLGLYQLAVDAGAVSELAGDAPSGGAELWQLRQDSKTGLKVQTQAPQAADEHGRTPVQEQLLDAVAAVRGERFEARPGSHCDRCAFAVLCPTQVSGTVLH